MESDPPPYKLFESPGEYYATCARFFDNLADYVPEFYSDNTLVLFCCNILPYEDEEQESIRQSHPKSPPSRDTEVLLYTASKLRLESYDWVTTGPILEKTVRAILNDFGLDSPVATLPQLLARLSFVMPKVLLFPDAAEVEPEHRCFYCYRCLCVHFARQLLPLPLFSEEGGQVFAEQLRQLSEYVLEEGDPDFLPCISPEEEEEEEEEDTDKTLDDQWFEHIEAAALELAEHENGEDILRMAPQIIQDGIDALSQAVYAQPSFPNVKTQLADYCREKGGNPWRHPAEVPTPRPLLWRKDFFAQAQGPRINVGNLADPERMSAPAEQFPAKRFRVRRDLDWPEDTTASGE